MVVGLPNNSYKPITNTAWVRARLCKLKKGPLDSQPQVINRLLGSMRVSFRMFMNYAYNLCRRISIQ
jgi:hypothetical protein